MTPPNAVALPPEGLLDRDGLLIPMVERGLGERVIAAGPRSMLGSEPAILEVLEEPGDGRGTTLREDTNRVVGTNHWGETLSAWFLAASARMQSYRDLTSPEDALVLPLGQEVGNISLLI